MDVVLGGLAGMGAAFFTNPLEVLKVRMQLQGELKARGQHTVHFRNMFHAAVVVAGTDGPLALQNGLVPALWTQLFLNGSRLGFYQFFDSQGLLKNSRGNVILHRSIVVGAVAGVLGSVLSSPFYLVKTHFQSRAAKSIAVGYQHKRQGMWRALLDIGRKHGVRGLWRGVVPASIRSAVGSTTQLPAFVLCKQWLHQHGYCTQSPVAASFIASMTGGIVKTVTMQPFDLVATRMYNQGIDSQGRGLLYYDYTDCVKKIWRTEGFPGFYKGLMPNYIRQGPHSVLCLMFWDILKDLHKSSINR